MGYIACERGEATRLGFDMGAGYGRAVTPDANDLDRYSKDENRIFISGVFDFNAAAQLVEAELTKLNERSMA
jgi:hypothetical protein